MAKALLIHGKKVVHIAVTTNRVLSLTNFHSATHFMELKSIMYARAVPPTSPRFARDEKITIIQPT